MALPTSFRKGKPASEAGGSVSFGKHFGDIDALTEEEAKKKSLKDSWVVFQATYKRSSFNNIPTDGVNARNRKRNFDGYGATVSYNARLAAGGEGTGILVGFSGGVERRNNLDDLTPVTIETQVASAVTATTTTIAKTVKNG